MYSKFTKYDNTNLLYIIIDDILNVDEKVLN